MFQGYPNCNSCIGFSFGLDLESPFEQISSINKFVKSLHQKATKKENEIISKVEKTVKLNFKKREREEEKEFKIHPDVQKWIDHFEKLGASGSVGLVPASFQKDFIANGKNHRIKYEDNDVIKTVQHFLFFYNKNNTF